MSKSTLFVLAGFLFVAVVLGTDSSNINRSPLTEPPPVIVSPLQACVARGYATACAQFIPKNYCSNLKCRTAQGSVNRTGPAPPGMWCDYRKSCSDNNCLFNSRMPEELEQPFELSQCR